MRLRNILVASLATLLASSCAKEPEALASGGVTAGSIEKKLSKGKSVEVTGRHIEGDLDLSSAGAGLRATPLADVTISGEIVFVNCVFEGRVSARKDREDGRQTIATRFGSDVSFIGCVFEGDVDFSLSTFMGRIRMEKCTVKGRSKFDGARATCGMTLNLTEFEGDASMDGLRLGAGSSLYGVKFRQAALLPNLWAEDNLMMADSRFDGITDFSHIHASGGVNLSNCEFANRVECRDGYVGGGVTLANAKFGGVVTCENLYVGGTVRLNSVSASRNIEVSGCVLLKEPDTSGITKSGDANIILENNRISSFPINAAK